MKGSKLSEDCFCLIGKVYKGVKAVCFCTIIIGTDK